MFFVIPLNFEKQALSQTKKKKSMKKQTTVLAILFVLISGIAEAQVYGGGMYMRRGYRRPPPRQMQRNPQKKKPPVYHPTVNLSIGYGYPNLDKNYFPDQFVGSLNAYRGSEFTQTGPVTAALDFQFSRYNSIGVIGTYGKASVPYYDFSSTGATPIFTGDLKSYSVMLNMMTYFPSYQTVSPYIRTAIGISNRTEDYMYPDGSKAVIGSDNLTDLAYQVSIGTRFNMSQNAGFYVEAGYGKYIVNGGLTFRF
jgi:hypothetical protein